MIGLMLGLTAIAIVTALVGFWHTRPTPEAHPELTRFAGSYVLGLPDHALCRYASDLLRNPERYEWMTGHRIQMELSRRALMKGLS